MDYWFFFSYARTDKSGFLEQFFIDLAEAVRPRVPLPADTPAAEVGFYDQEGIDVGYEWPDELHEGLMSSRVLVIVQSRGYMASPNCAAELDVFRERLAAYKAANPGAKAPPLALPVLWDTPKLMSLPKPLEKLQYKKKPFGETYAERGLRELAQQRKHADAYRHFVNEFAERVVSAAKPNLLPRIDKQKAAPAPKAPVVLEPDSGTASFVFLVGTASEVAKIRQDATAYDDDGGKWQPFRPEVCKEIRLLGTAAALDENLFTAVLPVDDDLLPRLKRAEKRQAYVLLVVDPWTARLDRFKPVLESFDELNIINTEMLVASGASDDETTALRDELLDELRETAFRKVSPVPTARDSITTADAFRSEVIGAIHDIRNRLSLMGARRRVRGSATSGSLPLARGPGST